MTLLDKALGAFGLTRKSLANPSAELLALFGATPTASGQSVTATTALRSTAVAAAVRLISEAFQTMPLAVYKRGPDNAREKDTSHPANDLLRGFSNPWTSGADLRQMLTQDTLLHGDGYAVVTRVDGKPRELHRLPPTATTIDTASGEPVYV
jgi:HK97 family phage portal protein